MTALAADKRRTILQEQLLCEDTIGSTAGATGVGWRGSIVCLAADGYGMVGADTASIRTLGIAAKAWDILALADGGVTIHYEWGHVESLATSVIVATDIGLDAVIADDATVTDAAAGTNDIPVGIIRGFTTGFAYVQAAVFKGTSA